MTVPDASELRGVRISVDSWRSFMGNWYVKVEIGAGKPMTLTFTVAAPSVAACDPAFVAELPGSNGVVLKIGHFDEVDGVTHVEI